MGGSSNTITKNPELSTAIPPLSAVIDFEGFESMGMYKHFKLDGIYYSKRNEKYNEKLPNFPINIISFHPLMLHLLLGAYNFHHVLLKFYLR